MPPKQRIDVFVGSTIIDLRDYRNAARDAIIGLGMHPIMMEDFPAADANALDFCLQKVDEAEVYLGIFAHCYGFCPDNGSLSITELEFNRATERDIPRLCFLLDDKVLWSPEYIEGEPGKTRLAQFKQRLENMLVITRFNTPSDLKARVLAALSDHLHSQLGWDSKEASIADLRKPEYFQELERIYLAQVAQVCTYLYTEGVDRIRTDIKDVFSMLSTLEISPESRDTNETIWLQTGNQQIARQRQQSTIRSLRETLVETRQLALLGEPGAGKSTVLQYIAHSFATNNEFARKLDSGDSLVPILVNLRNFDGTILLTEFALDVVARLGQFDLTSTQNTRKIASTLLMHWLKDGRLILLLDGLDEVYLEARQAVSDAIAQFATTPLGRECRIVVSSRIEGYREIQGLGETFAHYVLRPLSEMTDSLSYISRWLEALRRMSRHDKLPEANEIFDYLSKRPDFKSLSGNPLLLRLAITVWIETGELGQNRTELYRRYFNEVLARREQQRRLADVPWKRVQIQNVLMEIAWVLHTGKEQTYLQLADLVDTITGSHDGQEVLNYLKERLGLLATSGYRQGELIGFQHLTFKEYFVAQKLIPKILSGTAPNIEITETIRSFMYDLIHDRPYGVEPPPGVIAPHGMEYIPPGPAILGQDENSRIQNIPYGYFVDTHPVTNEEYLEFVKATKHPCPRHWTDGTPSADSLNHPVIYVTWYDAVSYAQWVGKRLLTEDEWEKAARGIDGRLFPWGNEFDKERCNTRENLIYHTSSVGCYSPKGDSPYGCQDMSGNVLEWTSTKPDQNVNGYILKGGSFNYDQYLAQCGSRAVYHPGLTHEHFGVRLGYAANENPSDLRILPSSNESTASIQVVTDIDGLVHAILDGTVKPTQINENVRSMIRSRLLSFQNKLYNDLIPPIPAPNGMVYVPPGAFIKGGDPVDNEKIWIVNLEDGFFIDKYPITTKQYREFLAWIKENPQHNFSHPAQPKNKDYTPKEDYPEKYQLPRSYLSDPLYDDFPIVNVDWWDAYTYCQWARKQLPTELEWEKAARGVDGRIYPWGDEFRLDACNSAETGVDRTTPVNHYEIGRSPYGCYDMIGNVWEWCLDKFDPGDTLEDTIRVVRGGSFNSDGEKLHCAFRNGRIPTDRWVSRGFRSILRIKTLKG